MVPFQLNLYKADTVYLHNNTILKSKLRIDLTYFRVAVAEVQLLNLLMYLFLTNRRCRLSVGIQSSVYKGRMLIVESSYTKINRKLSSQRFRYLVGIKFKLVRHPD